MCVYVYLKGNPKEHKEWKGRGIVGEKRNSQVLEAEGSLLDEGKMLQWSRKMQPSVLLSRLQQRIKEGNQERVETWDPGNRY